MTYGDQRHPGGQNPGQQVPGQQNPGPVSGQQPGPYAQPAAGATPWFLGLVGAYVPVLGTLVLAVIGLVGKKPEGPMWPAESLARWRNGWNWNISCGIYTLIAAVIGVIGIVLMVNGDADGNGGVSFGESPAASVGIVLWASACIFVFLLCQVQFWVAIVCGIRANTRKPTRMWPTFPARKP